MPRRDNRQRVSLVLEVGGLQSVASAAALLVVDLRDDFPDRASRDVLHRLDAIAATVTLLEQRLHLLRLTLSGDLDPRVLLGWHNSVGAGTPADVSDVLLAPRR